MEFDPSVGLGKESVVLSASHIVTGMNLGAPLANNDATSSNKLATKLLDSQALRVGIATVL
ncbi:hypothetical protein AU468_00375 [Alkalispirochaeta sphaeroplastigenens]|uniref:Uncharacterized protein n=1 Tax=Alkalispirochaeta sphaeroplastigenens TaxID=1187066 RepID=A0A2S4K1M6_9SPIO|nr:hypothetical protein AU468_00375 [Alkalispirochaeta sphaeroplastigenens]